MCTLVSIGCTADEERSGLNFIVGRFIGIMIIGMVIASIGAFVELEPIYFVVVFGVITIALGTVLILKAMGVEMRFPGPGKEHHGPGDGSGPGGQGCPKRRFMRHRQSFAVGLFRGATPCLKIMVLAPLLVSVDLPLALAMVVVFALTSTVYPLMGFLFGSWLRRFERYRTHLRVAGALILILVGIYSIANELAFAGQQRGY